MLLALGLMMVVRFPKHGRLLFELLFNLLDAIVTAIDAGACWQMELANAGKTSLADVSSVSLVLLRALRTCAVDTFHSLYLPTLRL